MSEAEVDLLIVGGGINGVGIARDAAGRGLSVLLSEKDDLAAHTSSASSKLIHGGLRYLEQFELKLVRESLAERERLLRAAPHIIEPLEFVIPRGAASRPAWMIRAGLFLYDRLAGREILPASRSVTLDRGALGLRDGPARAFSYWDCRVQDSRLVVINAIDAAERGAEILTRIELIAAHREGGIWKATLRGSGKERIVRARVLVNAAGPWAAELFGRLAGPKLRRSVRLVKGSHIVLPRLYPAANAMLLQNPDGRVVFAIPFEDHFTLVGTTDVDWTGDPSTPSISDEEAGYLLATVELNFRASVSRDDIAWSYSGIRALCDSRSPKPSRATRDFALELDAPRGAAPLLSVLGGKITTYRHLAEEALARLGRFFPAATPTWTASAVLPGGDIGRSDIGEFVRDVIERYDHLPPELLARFARTYGTQTKRLLQGVSTVADLGELFGAGLHAREVDYLVENEWAQTAEDIQFRRTKLGLHLTQHGVERLTAYLARGAPR